MQTALEIGILEQGTGNENAHVGRARGKAEHHAGQKGGDDQAPVLADPAKQFFQHRGQHAAAVHDAAEGHGNAEHAHIFQHAHHAAAIKQSLHGGNGRGQIVGHAHLEARGGGKDAVPEIKALDQAAQSHGKDRGQHDGRQDRPLEQRTGDQQNDGNSQ